MDYMSRTYEILYEMQQQDENASHDKIDREKLISFIKNLRFALFTNYYTEDYNAYVVEKGLLEAYQNIKDSLGTLYKKYENIINEFFDNLPTLRESLMLDANAFFLADPAANNFEEIISIYPGFTAIYCYRVAHFFYLKEMKHLSRIISEYAHSRTGIDINAGATIGKSFFIDHGTGVVIGETAEIGDNCKIYQGVTLGAMSLRDGRALKNKKRHPTLLNNVVIYSGSSIFGGDTVIGNNVTVGSNVEIKESIPDNTVVRGNPCHK